MFFANFKMKIFFYFIFFFVGNTLLGLIFKETFNDILISSVVLPYTRPKFVNMEICTMWPLNYFVEYSFGTVKEAP